MGPLMVADCWFAAENLMLAAYAMGLGTSVSGSAVPTLKTPEVKDELAIPAECTAIAPIIVGVAGGEARRSTRNEPDIFSWKIESQ